MHVYSVDYNASCMVDIHVLYADYFFPLSPGGSFADAHG